MVDFHNFYPKSTKIIIEALEFTQKVIHEHYEKIAATVDPEFRKPIWDEYKKIVRQIYDTRDFFKENINRGFISIRDEDYIYLMDVVSSSLIVYRQHLSTIKESTHVSGYSDLIDGVDHILSLDGPTKGKNDLFERYYSSSTTGNNNKIKRKTEFFISYQTKDREIACEIKRLLVDKSNLTEEDVFVAHRDIPLSKKWRDEITNHLNSCTHLIALCTENYKSSAWGNQEVGYAMAKGDISLIPLFLEDTERDRFGFLESFQTLSESMNAGNLHTIVEKILKKFALK